MGSSGSKAAVAPPPALPPAVAVVPVSTPVSATSYTTPSSSPSSSSSSPDGSPQPVLVLRRADRLMVTDADRELLNQWRKHALLRGLAAGGAVTGLVSFLFLRRPHASTMDYVRTVGITGAVGLLATAGGFASTVPQFARDVMLLAPPESQLRIAIFHVTQQMNPDLSPQHIYSLAYRRQRELGHELPAGLVFDSPSLAALQGEMVVPAPSPSAAASSSSSSSSSASLSSSSSSSSSSSPPLRTAPAPSSLAAAS